MAVDPLNVNYGRGNIQIRDATVNNATLAFSARNDVTTPVYPEAHFDGTTITVYIRTHTTNGVYNPHACVALVEDSTDVAGDFYETDLTTLRAGVVAFIDLGAHNSLTVGSSYSFTDISKAGTYRLVVIMGDSLNSCKRISNFTNGGAHGQYHFDSDNNVARGTTAVPTTLNARGAGWYGRNATLASLISSVQPNQGYTDQPTLTAELDPATSGTDFVSPKAIKIALRKNADGTIRKLLRPTPGSTGTTTTTPYNVDTQFDQAAASHDIVVGVNDVLGDSSTPAGEKPGLASVGSVNGLNTSQQAWIRITGVGAGLTLEAANANGNSVCAKLNALSVGYDVTIRSTVDVSSNPSTTRLYNRGETVSFDVRFNNVHGTEIDPDAVVLRLHTSAHAVEETEASDSVAPYNLTRAIGTGDDASAAGTTRHVHATFGHYGSNDPALDYTGTILFSVSSKILRGSAVGSNDGAITNVTPSPRETGETHQLSTFISHADGRPYTGKLVTANVKHSGGATEQTFTDTTDAATAEFNGSYTISSTARSTNDLTGDAKSVFFTCDGNTSDETATVFRVSRKRLMSKTDLGASVDPATIMEGVKTGKTAGADDATVRNTGQTLHFECYVYNVRGERLAGQTVHYNVRPIGSETYDEAASSSVALVAGKFVGSYAVDTDEATGAKTLVIASHSALGTSQPRTGTTGATGNFAESDTATGEWSVSTTYLVVARTQLDSTRNTDPIDTNFTIGEDILYAWAYVTDASGDPVNGVGIRFDFIDPNNATEDTKTATTGSDGYTPNPGTRFTPVPPKGTGWVLRATVDPTHLGNSGTDDQAVVMLSAFTADKNIIPAFGPSISIANGNGYATLTQQGSHPRAGDRLVIGVGYKVKGVRTAPDSTPVPRFMLSFFDLTTGKLKVLQSDGTWKSEGDVGYVTQYHDFKFNVESGLQWVAYIGTAAQGVTSGNGYLFDTKDWDSCLMFMNVELYFNAQRFHDDDSFLFIRPNPQHPFHTDALPETNVAFTGTGHKHTGGDEGFPIPRPD